MVYSIEDVKGLKGVKICHINRRLLSNFDELSSSISDILIDVVIVTETWLHTNCSENLMTIKGCKLLRLDRQVKTPCGAPKKRGRYMYLSFYEREYVKTKVWILHVLQAHTNNSYCNESQEILKRCLTTFIQMLLTFLTLVRLITIFLITYQYL